MKIVNKDEFKLVFLSHVAYRASYESELKVKDIYAKRILGEGEFSALSSWKDGEFLKWFVDESLGVQNAENYYHHEVVTVDYMVEVISFDVPILRKP